MTLETLIADNPNQTQRPAPKISIFKLLEAPSKARLETLSDAIFAVAMTILVLDLKVPSLPHDATSHHLWQALIPLWPKVGAFIISFLFLAKTWDVHRLIFHAVDRVNYSFSVLNVMLLMACCLLPFSTSLVSEHSHLTIAAWIYIANMISLPILNYLLWEYATRKRRLARSDVSPAVIEWFNNNHRVVIAVYSVAFPIAYFSSALSVLWIFTFQIIMHLVPFFSERMTGDSTEGMTGEA
jgi:uncharacterized membrane protein